MRTWTWVAIALGLIVVLVANLLGRQGSQLPLLSEFGAQLGALPGRLYEAPALLKGYLMGFLAVKKIGLVFVLLGLVALRGLRRGGGTCHLDLSSWVAAGLAVACFAIFAGPSTDWEHQFESRFDRLLLQWVGAAWIVVAIGVRKDLGSDVEEPDPQIS